MAKTVQLRNSTGQFCDLRDFCAERPVATIQRATSPRSAYEQLEHDQEKFLLAQQLAEIIKAFDLPEQTENITHYNGCGIYIFCDGTWGKSRHQINVRLVLNEMRSILAYNEQLSDAWTATEYTVEVEQED
jgi:hypothetical protein